MKTFEISNTRSGLVLGQFQASSKEEAIQLLMEEAGSDETPSDDLQAVLIEE